MYDYTAAVLRTGSAAPVKFTGAYLFMTGERLVFILYTQVLKFPDGLDCRQGARMGGA